MASPEAAPYFELDRKPRVHCSVVAVRSFAGRNVVPEAVSMLHDTQNRGEDGTGIAVYDGYSGTFYSHKDLGLVQHALAPEKLDGRFKGSLVFGHNRYATSGKDGPQKDEELRACLQPYVVAHKGKWLSLAHNGNFPQEYTAKMLAELPSGIPFQSGEGENIVDSEILAWRIMFSEGANWKEKVQNGLNGAPGAYSLVIGTDQGDMFGIKDPRGIRPLVAARLDDGFAILSETRGLEHIPGVLKRKEVGAGQMVHVTPEGDVNLYQLFDKVPQARCAVESIYLMHPFSFEAGGLEVRGIRGRMGAQLAEKYPFPREYTKVGVPASGSEIANAYARALGEVAEDFIKKDSYRPKQRTFMLGSDGERDVELERKFTISESVRGLKLVIVDDSVIRGKTTGRLVRALKAAGAIEVHVLSGSPRFVEICNLGVDIAKKEELIALDKDSSFNERTNAEIAKIIGADSINFLDNKGLTDAIDGKDLGVCTACMGGTHPIQELGCGANDVYSINPQSLGSWN